jgi:DNA polymerase III subunit beta
MLAKLGQSVGIINNPRRPAAGNLSIYRKVFIMITINKAALKAVSRFAAKSDIRYYLVGVYVEASETETRLVATDGHTMLVHRMKAENTHTWAGIIPLDTVAAILKHKSTYEKKGNHLPIELSECGGTEGRIDYAGQAFIFKPVDGKFPDYRRVIPKDITGEPACYQPKYLQRVQDAAVDLGNTKTAGFAMGYNGNGAAVCPINTDCLAVIMPISQDMLPAGAVGYDWVRNEVKVTPKLQAVA